MASKFRAQGPPFSRGPGSQVQGIGVGWSEGTVQPTTGRAEVEVSEVEERTLSKSQACPRGGGIHTQSSQRTRPAVFFSSLLLFSSRPAVLVDRGQHLMDSANGTERKRRPDRFVPTEGT